jgi:hypothetical protein
MNLGNKQCVFSAGDLNYGKKAADSGDSGLFGMSPGPNYTS